MLRSLIYCHRERGALIVGERDRLRKTVRIRDCEVILEAGNVGSRLRGRPARVAHELAPVILGEYHEDVEFARIYAIRDYLGYRGGNEPGVRADRKSTRL